MRKSPEGIIYSASDVVNFLECEHITTLDLRNLDAPAEHPAPDEQAELIQQLGIKHEKAYLDGLAKQSLRVVQMAGSAGALDKVVAETLETMQSGADVIYQAGLKDGSLAGYADFLVRVDSPSELGDFSYEVEDTKLARSPKAKFLVQLCFYSSLLAKAQGIVPERMHVVLGNGDRASYRVADYLRYFENLKTRFLSRVADRTIDTYPERCAKCDECRWTHLCEERWAEDDHLNLVADIRSSQIRKLNEADVMTLESLAQLPSGRAIPRLAPETLDKLRHQAELQLRARRTGQRCLELLASDVDAIRGFARMPEPNPADLYFDMEGDPLESGGLEYLFGVGTMAGDELTFRAFWAHSRAEEKKAFESFMDFVEHHLAEHPNAHVYHYASYEESALKRLMSRHGTREHEVDDLLRQHKLVDLYKVVRESMRVSEPRYSIKNIEHFYMDAREGEVQDAGASIVYYERWKQTHDDVLLQQIEDYNRDDVRSTGLLHRWLCKQRPANVAWRTPTGGDSDAPSVADDAERELEEYRKRLLDGISEDGAGLTLEQSTRVLTFHLLNFHRREQKPQWWAMFNRMELDESELIEDGECLGGLVLDTGNPPVPDKRSIIYTYRYPEQETKLKDGDACTRADTGQSLNTVVLDPDHKLVRLRIGAKREPLPDGLALGPGAPIPDKKLRARIRKFADSVIAGDGRFAGVRRLLLKQRPEIEGIDPGQPLVSDPPEVGRIIEVVSGLKSSYLFIQGPPGAGKTYTGSKVIAELLRCGRSVGIASNSHKAIHNLLAGVVAEAERRDITFRGFKKCSSSNSDSRFEDDRYFDNGTDVDAYEPAVHGLFAGTAWAFADLSDDVMLDFLFVDEAGQVSLANLVAMGLNARNIVLLGDQMQLGQPIQGIHPGRSGESTLEYLLDGRATIPGNEGIFLPLTWRMHPAVCGFISEAVYDGRLQSAPGLEKQHLVLNASAHAALAPAGIRYWPVEHADCSQRSEEEANLIREVFDSLLHQSYADRSGAHSNITTDDILVVSPYNMQVNLLKSALPEGARVGTVDKFQGQEAQVVIVSMATSSGNDLPREIEFLYSKNRLNVAISRAKCLAIVVANPQLMSVHCSTPEQMALINTLCWVKECGEARA